MSATKYPFRYYGREPADWIASQHGYLYDLQFASTLEPSAREDVHALAERHFGRGAAMLADIWHWGGDRFLVFSLAERFGDAARMIFTQVTEFLSVVHQSYPLRDVVFCNAIGARADRWDAWSLQRSPEPDAGPARPDEAWATLLRRPVDAALSWEGSAARARAAPAPAARPKGAKKYTLEACPEPDAGDPALSGWQRIEADFASDDLVRVKGARVPLGWARREGRFVALVCIDGAGNPRRIDLPPGVTSNTIAGPTVFVAVDPDGLHAVTHVDQHIYSVDLAQGGLRWRVTVHENNGPVLGIAWVVDDLWAVRCTNQLMLFDLSEEDCIYVGTQQPSGTLLGSFRHGTVLPVQWGNRVTLFGVCDWQIKQLTHVSTQWLPVRILNDELYLGVGEGTQRVVVDAVYEAWAAGLRKRAEKSRQRRFKPPKKGVRWRWTSLAEMPPDALKAHRKELQEQYGDDVRADIDLSGDAVLVSAREGFGISRGAELRFRPAGGEARKLESPDAARDKGVTNFSMDPRREVVFFVAGSEFSVHRVEIEGDRTVDCDIPGFKTRTGLLYEIVALDRGDVIAVWNNTLDWHREAEGPWTMQTSVPLDLPRGTYFDAGTKRIAVMQQSRDKLLVFAVGSDGLTSLATCADGVKLLSFREAKLYAQMVDGQWFELLGAEVIEAS